MKLKITNILLAAALFAGFSSCRSQQKPKPPPPNVTVATIEQRDVNVYVDVIGQAIQPVTVAVTPQVNGKLIAVYVQQGDIVHEGDLLYTVDPRPYQAILDEAVAQYEHDKALLDYAEDTVKRYKPVVEDDFISILAFEQYVSTAVSAKAQVELDLAAIRAAQLNVDFCSIVAPVSGKISYYNVDVGNIVSIDQTSPLTTIRPFSMIDIQFSLSQQQFETVRKVQGNEGIWPFKAYLPEHPERIVDGKTYFVDNQIDQDTGTIFLKGRLENKDRLFWPGEFVKVQVLHMIAPNALVVPPGAVLVGKNGFYVYTVDKDNKVWNHDVQVLYRTDQFIALEAKDIHAGDKVVTDGQINIAPGMVVNILKTETNTPKITNEPISSVY